MIYDVVVIGGGARRQARLFKKLFIFKLARTSNLSCYIK